MSRRIYLLGVGLALVALALAVTDWALGLPPEVTEANLSGYCQSPASWAMLQKATSFG